jgi:DNA-binding XRE family transcriptional regulator
VRKPPPVPDLVAFGHEVARLRRERGWSIDVLAETAGISRKTVINVEGAKKGLRLSTAHDIAHALDVPLSELVVKLCERHSGRTP